MARAQSSDFLQNFRYLVTATAFPGGGDPLQAEGGFNSVTIPDITVEIAEYREGIFTFTRKFPGIPAFTDVTLTKGVVRGDTKFFDWIQRCIGDTEYRTDVLIYHFHRDDRVNPAKVYRLNEAFATRTKLAGDLDATSSDVSISEMDISFEFLQLDDQA